MTTVVLERIADGVFVALLLRGLLFLAHGDDTPVRLARYGANVMFARLRRRLPLPALRRLAPRPGGGAGTGDAGPAVDRARRARLGRRGQLRGRAEAAPPPRRAGRLLRPGRFVYWGLNGFGMWVLMRAFPFQLSLVQAYVVMCLVVVGVMIPAAPGMVGTFQAAVKLGLSIFLPASVVNGPGLAYANVLWLCQTVAADRARAALPLAGPAVLPGPRRAAGAGGGRSVERWLGQGGRNRGSALGAAAAEVAAGRAEVGHALGTSDWARPGRCASRSRRWRCSSSCRTSYPHHCCCRIRV